MVVSFHRSFHIRGDFWTLLRTYVRIRDESALDERGRDNENTLGDISRSVIVRGMIGASARLRDSRSKVRVNE